MTPPLITLLTDFGTRDPYVAAMKGVIAGIAPHAQILDLGHEIPPQAVMEGALFLAAVWPYYPPGTIHVAVIDPGVGTKRRAIAVQLGEMYYVGPDNGLLTLVLREHALTQARNITNTEILLPHVSPTFHGRDVFAPAAAALASGLDFETLGEAVHDLEMLEIPQPLRIDEGWEGEIIHVDRFGNLITNVPKRLAPRRAIRRIEVGGHSFRKVHKTYGRVAPGDPLALIGSAGYLEIAVREGNARERLALYTGDRVTVYLEDGC